MSSFTIMDLYSPYEGRKGGNSTYNFKFPAYCVFILTGESSGATFACMD